MVTAGSELNPGTSVDRRYRIQCTLGRGGFGRTYLASDERRFGELCVLKEFVPNSQADPVVAQKLRELFQREAAILHKLDHPQIPKFFAGFEEGDRLFIAQEYIDGKTYWRLLQERLRHKRTFSQIEIIGWLRDLLRVLDYLHTQNIVHRDISPDNVMLPKGHKAPVLIDFGVVKQTIPHLNSVNPGEPDDLIQASVSVGKFGYAPYEQIQMGQCSPRGDLYALAVTAVVLLTGKPPNLLIDAKSLEWQWQRWIRLDPRLAKILTQMMADKPQDRYPSAKTVLDALQPLCDELNILETPVSTRRPVRASTPLTGVTESMAGSTQLKVDAVEAVAADELPPELLLRGTAITGRLSTTHIHTELDPHQSSEAPSALASRTSLPTHLEGAIVPVKKQQLVWTSTSAELEKAADQRPLSARSLLELIRAVVLQSPQDRLGNAKRPLRLSFKQICVLGILALLPIGGAVVGVRSPHIASICWALENCAGDLSSEERYRQAIELADSASVLTNHARTLTDLQTAREHLANSVAQLNAFAGSSKVYAAASTVLPKYQMLLSTLDQHLEKETRAAQLLSRAEAEAQKASEQTNAAKTTQHYRVAQIEWRRALATLAAIPNDSFVNNQATARLQEYKARLEAINLKVGSAAPRTPPSSNPLSPATVHFSQPSVSQPATTVASAPVQVAPPAEPPPAGRQQPTQPAPKTSSRSAPQQTQRPNPPAARAPHRVSPARNAASTANQQQTPSTSPLEVDSRWIAGNIVTSATQTLNNVSIWIDGSRTEADGRFVANLWIQNRSGRGFGFVPLYAESRDPSGQTVRSRVLFTGTADTMLEPGESLNGQIYLLERPSSSRLSLVIQESTSGNRTFRIPF